MNFAIEEKLLRNENVSFIKLLVENEIKSYKYNIAEEDLSQYVERNKNSHLYKEIQKYNLSNFDLEEIRDTIIKTSKYNLEVEYLPTEDWEFEVSENIHELVLTIPTFDMLKSGLQLFILVFPFAALFVSYSLITIFK